MNNHAIVTFAVGEEYLKNFNAAFRPSVERYAKRLALPLIVLEEFIRPSAPHIFWQKFFLFSQPIIARYDKVVFVDADIYITTHAKNVFDAVGDKPWGIVKSNPYDLAAYAITDLYYFQDLPKEKRPPFAANVGVCVLSKSYKDQLENLFLPEWAANPPRGYESGPLFRFLYNEGKGIMLDPEFNTPVALYVLKYGHSLSAILRMYDSASFLHFVAGKWHSIFLFIRWFDTTESHLAKRLVRFFGTRRFDFITAPAFRIFQRGVGIYDYRLKKFFS